MLRSRGIDGLGLLVGAISACVVGLAIHAAASTVVIAFILIAFLVAIRSRFAYAVIPIWAGLYLAAAPRMIVKIPDFGAGLVPLAGLATILFALAAVSVSSVRLEAVQCALRRMWPALALVVLWAALPVLGVIAGYPVRTLMASVVPLCMLAFATLGVVGRLCDRRMWMALYWGIAAAVWVGAAVGLLQTGITGATFATLGSALRLWDVHVASLYGVPMLYGRQVGLFINPNTFSLLGAFGMLFGVLAANLSARRRVGMVVPSLIILVLSASRAAMVAVIIAFILDAIRRVLVNGERSSLSRIAALGGATVTAIAASAYLTERFSSFVMRMSSGLGVVRYGAEADANFAERLALWADALKLLISHPFGTFGPPQLALGASIDNEYLFVTLQGGVLLLGLYVIGLASLYRGVPGAENQRLLRSTVTFFAIVALSQNALATDPAMVAVWLVAGASFAGSVMTHPHPAAVVVARPSGSVKPA